MKATITKVDPIKTSPRSGDPYQAVYFKMEDGKSAHTYLSPKNRNYKRWQPLLKEGNVLDNLILKSDKRLVDADSLVKLING